MPKSLEMSDLLFPAEDLLGVTRKAQLAYLVIRLHVDENGVCMSPQWLMALLGLYGPKQQQALRELKKIGVIEIFFYENLYGGQSTAVRLPGWKCPTRQDRITGNTWREIRRLVFERDSYRCAYCESVFQVEELECDHIVPISAGGTNELGNLVTACGPCNLRKHAKVIDLFRKRVG